MAIRKQYKTMQGRVIDLEKLAAKNELVPAIGNVPVNARGDELGPGGRIVRKREDIMQEYYSQNASFTPVEKGLKRVAKEAEPNIFEEEDIEEPADPKKPTE